MAEARSRLYQETDQIIRHCSAARAAQSRERRDSAMRASPSDVRSLGLVFTSGNLGLLGYGCLTLA